MKTLKSIILGLTLVSAISSVSFAQSNPCGGKNMKSMGDHGGMVFTIEDPMGRNTVTFKSTAPLEDIVGTSNQISGQLVFDPNNPDAGGHGEFVVPVKTLNTGIPLRDEHLAGADWLNADKNPNIEFRITEVKNVKEVKSTKDAKTFEVTAIGDFSLNGKTKRISVPARITYLKENKMTEQKMPGDLLAARTTFEVALADFGITGPKGMNLIGSKVGEKVEIDLSLIASSAGGAMAGNPCGGKAQMTKAAGNPCGGKAAMNPCGGKKPQNPCNPCGGKM
ncbi:MAG: YceI family protein [bacterium]|nr:YceI family protein [bacterium]